MALKFALFLLRRLGREVGLALLFFPLIAAYLIGGIVMVFLNAHEDFKKGKQ